LGFHFLALLDFSNPFDTVNFKLLCQKFKNLFTFSDSTIKLVKSYLMGRSQCVFANGALSSFLDDDDVQIYLSGSKESIASVVNQINSDLASISDWSTQNGLRLNSQKTQTMANYRNSYSPLPPVRIGDTIILYSNKVKNLGVIMNCNLTWNDQILSIVSGVNGRADCAALLTSPRRNPSLTCRSALRL
jgi:hypothetical protein